MIEDRNKKNYYQVKNISLQKNLESKPKMKDYNSNVNFR